ncbi:zinc finger and SCAN domain-containing protein 2 [Fundulus heteroclitus]|uniref:zinc finger and SCAN domain-containing protein 2 n=1 Tax=Fundulus heteroclitus TaxID=8078 RepID=UPI00165C3970|nr:zinc finger and SCAN domain-containing protein 2 [Fundulus heteroclitus]
MAETIQSFQSQLSGVMETVFKAAIYEITRLVEDSFVEEVLRCREQVESLEKRLMSAESRRKERQDNGKEMCVDCGRARMDGESKSTVSEKSLKQESVSQEEAESYHNTAGERLINNTEEDTQEANGGEQSLGEQEDARNRQLKEETSQGVLPRNTESHGWSISKEETDTSSLPGPSKHFSEQNNPACHLNWKPSFNQRPELSQDGQSEVLSESNFQGRYGLNELGSFGKPGYGEMGNFDRLQGSPTHLLDDLRYVDQYNENRKPSEGAEHQCYTAGSPQNRGTGERSPVRTNRDVSGEFSCLLIDEEGYLQEPNVRYTDQVSGDLGSRMSCRGQGVQFPTGAYELSAAYNDTLNLEQRLHHQNADNEARSSTHNHCFTSLPNSVSFKSHKPSHKGTGQGSSYICNQCGKTFTQACNLKVHQRIHLGQGLHLCSHCGKGFPSFANLKTHKCSQTGNKPYCCAVCGNKFSRLWNLKLHQRIHTHEKPHRCSMCDKSFTRADILKVHQRTHTGERPYCCAVCGLSFKRLDHLKTHQRKHVTNL